MLPQTIECGGLHHPWLRLLDRRHDWNIIGLTVPVIGHGNRHAGNKESGRADSWSGVLVMRGLRLSGMSSLDVSADAVDAAVG